jgi:hypothetical protein
MSRKILLFVVLLSSVLTAGAAVAGGKQKEAYEIQGNPLTIRVEPQRPQAPPPAPPPPQQAPRPAPAPVSHDGPLRKGEARAVP